MKRLEPVGPLQTYSAVPGQQILLPIGSLLLCSGNRFCDMPVDGSENTGWQQFLVRESFPDLSGPFGRLAHDVPDRFHRKPGPVGEASHPVESDQRKSGEPAVCGDDLYFHPVGGFPAAFRNEPSDTIQVFGGLRGELERPHPSVFNRSSGR